MSSKDQKPQPPEFLGNGTWKYKDREVYNLERADLMYYRDLCEWQERLINNYQKHERYMNQILNEGDGVYRP